MNAPPVRACSAAQYTDPVRNMPVLMVIASILAGLGIVQMTFLVGHGLYRTTIWNQERAELRVQIQRLQQDIRTLESVRDRADDPAALENFARCQGFVGKNERVVVDENATVPREGNCESVPLP